MTNCYLCNAVTRIIFSAKDHKRPQDQSIYPVAWCDACSMGRVDRDLTTEEIGRFYDIPYYTHEAPVAGKVSNFSERIMMRVAYQFDQGRHLGPSDFGPDTAKTVCDVGCGHGHLLGLLKAAGFKGIGIEPDPAARLVAQNHADIFAGTAENIPAELDGRKFDFVVMSHVLEHCKDPLRALKNCRSLLNPGGTIFVEVPNNAALPFKKYGELWPWSDIPRHLNFFTEASLKTALERTGFRPQKTNYVGYVRQYMPRWIEGQKSVWEAIGPSGRAPNFYIESLKMLARTALAPNAQKYDSVRVVAVNS